MGLKQLIKAAIRITSSTSTLTDHILTCSTEKVGQAGIIEKSLSDHQFIICTRKIKRAKPNKNNYFTFRSMKSFSTENYEETLGNLIFPDYENFVCVNKAYSDLTSKIFDVVSKVTPTKTIRVKNNTNEWFEIAEKIAAREKLLRKSKISKSNVDKIPYKEARNTVQALIKDKKRKLLQEKLSENIGKPKELWKIIKKLGLPEKGSHNKFMP